MEEKKKKIIDRLRRIEGQARGIQKMVAESRSCDDIITQVAALKAATSQVGSMILSSYLLECMNKEVNEGKDKEEVINKFQNVLKKFV